MADVIVLDFRITIPNTVEAAADMPERWASGLTNNAEVINSRRIEKIGSSGDFETKVAAPSNAAFKPMIDAAFVSKSGRSKDNIARNHYKNLSNSFNQYNDKLDQAFATVDGIPAKRFKEQVNNNKNAWAEAVADKTLRATGDRIRGLILPQALYWMTGDPLANGMTNAFTLIAGAPYDFVKAGLNRSFKSATMPKLTQSLIAILDADMLAAEMTIQNDFLALLGNAFKDAAVKTFVVAGGATDSLLKYEYTDPTLTLHGRIVLV